MTEQQPAQGSQQAQGTVSPVAAFAQCLPKPFSTEELTRWLFAHPDYVQLVAAAMEWMTNRRKALEPYAPRLIREITEGDLSFKPKQIGMPGKVADMLVYQRIFRALGDGNYVVAQFAEMDKAFWAYIGERNRAETEARLAGPSQPVLPAGAPPEMFRDLLGYEDVRREILLYMRSADQPNILLQGPRSTGKTIIIEDWGRMPGAVLRYGRGISGAGIRKILMDERPPVFVIDEVDKLDDAAQEVLLEAAERHTVGILHHGENRSVEIPTRFYAACNRVKDLLPEFQSRFHRIVLREYSFEEFVRVATMLLMRKGIREDFAKLIAVGVGRKSKDIRDARRVGEAALGPGVTPADVQFLVDRLNKEADV